MTTFALPSPRKLAQIPRWMVYTAGAALLIVAIVTFAIVRSQSTVRYATEPVAQQTLVQSVTASGTVNPQNNISVGTQVSGTIATIYVDYNSKVKKGQVLARLDPSTLPRSSMQANAALAQSQAHAAQAGASQRRPLPVSASPAPMPPHSRMPPRPREPTSPRRRRR